MMAGWTFGTFNVQGIRGRAKRVAVFDFLALQRLSAFFVQEAHLRDSRDVQGYRRDWAVGESFWSVGDVHSSGVWVLLGDRGFRVTGVSEVVQGRVIGVDAEYGGVSFRLVCVYGAQRAGERGELFRALLDLLVTNRVLVVGGDFNCVLGDQGDSSAGQLRD